MALANLTINVNANVAGAKSGLQDVGSTARQSMGQSTAAVDDFRVSLLRASDDLARAAKQIGGNMDAANDAIVSGSKKSEDAVQSLTQKVDDVKFESVSEKAAAAFGAAFGAGYLAAQTWVEKTEQYVVEKAKVIGIGLAIGLVSATAAAVYGAYRIIKGTVGFIEGLFTGDAYKSQNIDALIAANKQIIDLQSNLQISAQQASALADALARLGVDKGDYKSVYADSEKAARSNGEELDRLGVKYKDVNGKLLETGAFLTNVKTKLEEYTQGYDRNAAAAAIGVGSYEKVTSVLKVNQAELARSKERIDEYGLAIGPQTQAYVAAYETAMREFAHETDLTSQGFKRAVADNIMPILTDLADFFKDGFPFAVRVFRYTMAEVTSLFYGLKTATYIVAESILGLVESIGLGIGAVGSALIKVFQGDFSGAKEAMVRGWEDAKTRFGQIGENITTQALKNRDAIVQAWGLDDRNELGAGPKPGGKPWVPKPAPAAAEVDKKSPYEAYLNELDRMVKKLQENEYASMRLRAQQLAEKEGITDLTAAYEKINAIQRGESQRAVDEYTRKLKEENDQYKFQTDILALTTFEQDKLTLAMNKHLEVERAIEQAKRSGKPLDEQAIADLRTKTEETIALAQAQMQQRRDIERSAEFGATKAMQAYVDSATNAAAQVQNALANAFKGAEDALVNFVKTGKLDFKSLADSIITDLIRIQAKQVITSLVGSGSGGSGNTSSSGGLLNGIGGFFKSLLGFADGGDPPVGVPSIVGENGPELFIPKSAGTIIPNGASGGSGATFHQTFQINAPNATAETVGQIRALMPALLAENKRAVVGIVQASARSNGGRVPA